MDLTTETQLWIWYLIGAGSLIGLLLALAAAFLRNADRD